MKSFVFRLKDSNRFQDLTDKEFLKSTFKVRISELHALKSCLNKHMNSVAILFVYQDQKLVKWTKIQNAQLKES